MQFGAAVANIVYNYEFDRRISYHPRGKTSEFENCDQNIKSCWLPNCSDPWHNLTTCCKECSILSLSCFFIKSNTLFIIKHVL